MAGYAAHPWHPYASGSYPHTTQGYPYQYPYGYYGGMPPITPGDSSLHPTSHDHSHHHNHDHCGCHEGCCAGQYPYYPGLHNFHGYGAQPHCYKNRCTVPTNFPPIGEKEPKVIVPQPLLTKLPALESQHDYITDRVRKQVERDREGHQRKLHQNYLKKYRVVSPAKHIMVTSKENQLVMNKTWRSKYGTSGGGNLGNHSTDPSQLRAKVTTQTTETNENGGDDVERRGESTGIEDAKVKYGVLKEKKREEHWGSTFSSVLKS